MKYFFMSAALVGSLALPLGSFAATSSDNQMDGFYTKLQYNGEFFNRIGKLSPASKDLSAKLLSNTLLELIDGSVSTEEYKVDYKPSYLGGSVALGYSMAGSVRVEVEGLYSRIKVKNKDLEALSLPSKVVVFEKNPAKLLSANEGFTNFAGMFNAYYDFANVDMPFIPYVGAGIGLTKINFLDSDKFAFAYQVKGGLMCPLSQNSSFFAGYRYFGVLGDKFSVEAVEVKSNNKLAEKVKMDVTNSFAVHGIEAGLIFKF